MNLVAVDFSRSGIASLPRDLLYECLAFAPVRLPSELVSIGNECFFSCHSLRDVDLSGMSVMTLALGGHRASGVIRLSLPATLRVFECFAVVGTPLKTLDLSLCAGVTASETEKGRVGENTFEVRELRLPCEHFVQFAEALLPGSRVEALCADIDADEAEELLGRLSDWGIERCGSSRETFRRPSIGAGRSRSRSTSLIRPSAAFVTKAWPFVLDDIERLNYLPSIDMSALALSEFPLAQALPVPASSRA
jgi:hypothetical protein